MHGLRLCISYDHTLAISTDVANSACARFASEGVVCPPQDVTGVFTTAAVDNIDHNPSSTTSQGSFHRTAISLLQHPTQKFPGTPRAVTVIDNNLQGQRALSTLPDAYTLVSPVALPSPDPLPPPVAASMQLQPPTELNQLNSVSSWLTDSKDTLLKPELQENDIVPWDTYSSSQHEEHPHPLTPAYLLSLFPEAANSVAMIFHAMNVVKAVVAHLNPASACFSCRPPPVPHSQEDSVELSTDIWRGTICHVPSRNARRDSDFLAIGWAVLGGQLLSSTVELLLVELLTPCLQYPI